MTSGADEADHPTIDDAARERMVGRLRDHVGSGDLTLAEFEDRVTRALAAHTGAELEAATVGLPAVRVTEPRRLTPRRWIVAVFGGSTTRGRWRVAERLRTVAVFGGSDIDLRSVEFEGSEITIESYAFCGGDEIYLPDSVDVEVTGFALFGGNDLHGGSLPARRGAPIVRIRVLSLFGGIDVYRLPAEAAGLSLREARRLAKGNTSIHNRLH